MTKAKKPSPVVPAAPAAPKAKKPKAPAAAATPEQVKKGASTRKKAAAPAEIPAAEPKKRGRPAKVAAPAAEVPAAPAVEPKKRGRPAKVAAPAAEVPAVVAPVAPAGERVGYVRVSTQEQSTARQLEGVALDRVFTDRMSGKSTARPQLEAMLRHLRVGDTLVVHSLDRLARNLSDLRALVADLTGRGVKIEFVKEVLVFAPGGASPMSSLLLNLLGAVAEFERAIMLERQREGIAIAHREGRYKGRAPALSDELAAQFRARVLAGDAVPALVEEFGVSRATGYRLAAEARGGAANK